MNKNQLKKAYGKLVAKADEGDAVENKQDLVNFVAPLHLDELDDEKLKAVVGGLLSVTGMGLGLEGSVA